MLKASNKHLNISLYELVNHFWRIVGEMNACSTADESDTLNNICHHLPQFLSMLCNFRLGSLVSKK